MAYNSKSFRKTNGLPLSAPNSTGNPQEKSQYDSSAFRSALGDLDQLKAFNERSKVMNDYRSRNKVAYDNYQREVRSPAYQVQQLNQYVTEQYGYDPGITAKDVDDYISTFNSYLDGTNMSDSAVSFRKSMNSDNQQRTDKYNAALNERDNIQRQMNVFEQGGRAWDDSEYNRLQGLLGGINQDISDMEESGYRNSAYEAARYRRSGQDTKDKYADIRRRTGFSDARSRVTGGENYSLEDDDLGRYFENKDYVTPLPDIDTGDYNYSQYENPDKANGDRRHWDLLTDDEINTYYSILETDGKSKATQYLDDMQITLDRRNTEANSFTKEEIEKLSAVDRAGVSVATVLANVAGAVPAFMDDAVNTLLGEEINPYSNAHLAQNFASDTRSSTAEYIDEKTGAKDTDFMTWGNVYQAIMSAGDSMVGALIGPTAYGITMGMGAASSRAKELYDSGATTNQIVKSSLASGAAEMLFEKLSMSLLLDKVVKYGAGGFKDFAKGILVQGLGEGSEEFFTEIANTITDALFAYDFSNWKADKEAYLSEHPDATDEEALSYAIFSTGRKALQAAAAGAISGSAMGAGGTAVGYVKNKQEGNRLLNGSQSQLENIIYGADDVMNSYKNAKLTDRGFAAGKLEQLAVGKDVAEIKSKYDSGNLTSKDAAKLGKVSSVMQQAIISQDVEKIASAAENKLREMGVTDTYEGGEEVSTLAKAIAKTVAGEDLNSWEKSAIRNSEQAKQILQEIAGASDVVQKYAESGAAYQVAEQKAEIAGEELEQAKNDVSMDADFQTAAENFQKADEKRTAAKEAFDAAQNEYENGSTAWARSIGARVVGDGVLAENSVEGYSHLFGKHAKLFTEAYEDGQDARQYTIEFAKAYNAGVNGVNIQQLISDGSVKNLNEAQINAAYQAGIEAKKASNERKENINGTVHLRQSSFWQDGQNPGESAQGVESNAEQNQERNAESGGEEAAAGSTGAAEIRTGKVIKTQEELGIKNAKPGVKLTHVGSDFSEETKKASAMAKQTGVKVIFFTGGYLQLEDGRLARGMKQGDTIYLRADDPNFSASAIAGHESTHVLLDSGRLDRSAVLDALKGKYKAEELNAFAADYFGTDATIDELIDEIICDAMGGMNAFAKSKGKAAFLQEVQGLAEKAIKETGTGVVDSSQKLSSVENDLKEGAKPVDHGEIITDGVYVVSGDSKYSMVSMKSDIAEGVMFRDLLSHGIMNETDITKLKSDLESLLEYMRPNRDILDMNETYGREGRRFSPYKPNSDPLYKISMDFSTLCSKRLLTQYVIEQLQLRENRPMTAKEQMAIRAMLNDYRQQENALQVACAMCYVEAARLKSPGQMEKWMSDPMSGMKDFFSKKNADFNKRVKDAQSEFKVNHGYDADTPKKKMKASDVTQLNKIGPKMRAEYQMSPEEAAIAERAAQLPRSTYLTAANLANLRDAEPDIYSAYTTFIRNATRSKALETDEPYYYGDSTRDNGNGVVVTDSFIEAVNKENGMRFSSWSDWRIQHMLDYITAVIDNSVRGAAMHGYTKFTQEVRVLGKTGMMFNLSGVPGTQNGLNPDGSLSFSDTESIAVDQTGKSSNDALAMRDMFPETAGLQCIGVSDAHIHALLASDIIDYVIPYHTSGLNAALRRMAGIYGWKDYTNVQNAKIDSSIKGDSSIPGWHVEPVFSEFFVGYNTGMTGIEAMRKSAENYINMCRERGMTPKFEAFTGDENYWKLLIDRKMINQKTGKLIQQKPVKPVFDFAEIRKVVDETVENYDSGLESRALAYIVENWDSVGDKIKELEKAKKASKTKAVKNVDTLANEMLAAQQKGAEQKLSAVSEDLTAGYKQKLSAVNSTQLALENPDVYDEIQVTYDEILQKTKGKDLETALLEEAQKHREDLQMWEHEAAVLTKLWKQSEKNEAKLSKALSERRDRIAEVSEELRERRRDVRTMENEFIRVVREWEKQTGKLEGKTKEAASLKQALKDSIREHRQDNAAWEREYDRLLKMYERNDRKIDRLAADIAHRKEMAAKGVEGRKRTVIRNKILELNKDFQKILDHPGKGDTAHAPRDLISPIAEFCGMFANAEYGYRTNQLNQSIKNGNSQTRIDQIARAQSLLADISNRYAKLSKESGLAGSSYQQETADQIARATELISDMFDYRNIHEMSSDELTVVYNAMKSIMHSIKTANRLTAMETTRTLVETVDRFKKNIDEATPASRMSARYAQRYLMWQMSPHEFFQYICGYAKDNVGLDIDRMFKRGTEKMLGVQRDFDDLFNPILNQDDKEIRRMTSTKEKDLVTVGLQDRNGNEVKLTRGMRLSVYMMLSQEDGLRSIAYGGFALPRIEEYYHGNISAAYGGEDIERLYTASQGGTIYEAAKTLQSLKAELKEAQDDAQRESLRQSVSAAQERLDSLVAGEEARLIRMREDIWDSFSDYEKQLVDAANQWMEHSGNLMQETYYELNGFDPVRVNHYWPIHRDPTTIQSLDTTSVANEINLANSGFTKERVKAKNPILLTDFFQELMSSKQKMSRYYGFAVAQRDFDKLYMFKYPGSSFSVKKRIMAKFQSGTYKIGVSAEQYIDNYIKSVSGANKADGSWLSDLYSRSAGATLTANARVALSQLASIPTAAAVVGWKNAAIGFSRGIGYALSKQAKDQLAGDSVWFYQRYKGEGSTREIADMRNSGGLAAKAMNSGFARKYLNWCQNMDVLATGPIMWEMAKASVLETGMQETDPGFKAAVQDKYADIIRFSQPNYTETERSDLLRDKRVGSKILTMYKTQSNQNLNILIGASLEMRKMKSDFKAGKNGVTEADVKAATAKCVSAYTAVAIGNTVLFPLLRFIGNLIIRNMKPYKDDETGEVDLDSVMDGILKDAFSSMFGTVAMGSILYDGVYAVLSGERYYGISDNAVGLLSDTLTSMVTLGQSVTSGKNVTDKAVKMLLNLASSFGIPAKNLKNLATAAYGWANQLLTGGHNVFDATDTTSKQDNARFVSAVLADKEEKAGNELSYLISKSDEPNLYLQSKDAASNVKEYLKDQFEERRISEDDATKVLRYLEYEDEDIEADIKQWKCVVETGIKYGNIGKSVMKGIITEDYAVELYITYGGLSESEAMDKVYVHVFNQTYPKLSDLSEAGKLKFRTASESGISADVFATAYRACSGGKKKDIVNYIMSIRGLTMKQRKALWDAVKGNSTDEGTPFA